MKIHSILSLGTVDGPGVRTVVFCQGCAYRCSYCHNPDSWDCGGGHKMTVGEIVDKVKKYRSYFGRRGGVTLSGGEPLLQAKEAALLFSAIKAEGIHTCLDTSGSVGADAVQDLLAVTDLVLLDIKHSDPVAHRALTGGELSPVLSFRDGLIKKHIPFWVRHVIVPGITDGETHIKNIIEMAAAAQKIELLAYHTRGREKWDKLKMSYPLEGVEPTGEDTMVRLRSLIPQNQR